MIIIRGVSRVQLLAQALTIPQIVIIMMIVVMIILIVMIMKTKMIMIIVMIEDRVKHLMLMLTVLMVDT